MTLSDDLPGNHQILGADQDGPRCEIRLDRSAHSKEQSCKPQLQLRQAAPESARRVSERKQPAAPAEDSDLQAGGSSQ